MTPNPSRLRVYRHPPLRIHGNGATFTVALMAALERRATELTVEVRDDEEANLKALLAGGPTRPNTRRLSRNAGDDADGWAWTWVSGADLTRHVEWVIKEHIGLWNPQAAPTSHYNLARRLVRDIAAHFNIFLY